jgi:hypothetical protein
MEIYIWILLCLGFWRLERLRHIWLEEWAQYVNSERGVELAEHFRVSCLSSSQATTEHCIWGTQPGGLVTQGFGPWTVTESFQNSAFPAKLILYGFRDQEDILRKSPWPFADSLPLFQSNRDYFESVSSNSRISMEVRNVISGWFSLFWFIWQQRGSTISQEPGNKHARNQVKNCTVLFVAEPSMWAVSKGKKMLSSFLLASRIFPNDQGGCEVSLWSWPQTCNPPSSASWMLGLQTYTTTLS